MPNSQLPQIFISYRKETVVSAAGIETRQTPARVRELAQRLHASGAFAVFIDDLRLQAADAWADRIISELSKSRVLIVMLRASEDKEIDTGWSDWVQREVDVARGERITIVPIKMEEARSSLLQETLKQLGLSHLQYTAYPETDDDFARFANRLRQCVEETNRQQRRRIQELESRFLREMDVEPYQSRVVYQSPYASCRIHLGCGDIARARNIDVIVNSENNYMQMARFHEPKHLSSRLRFAGALTPDGSIDQYIDDTLQDELSAQVKRLYPTKPVPAAAIVPTHAGHPQSQLAQQGTRYIFHASAVLFSFNGERGLIIAPLPMEQVSRLTENCLNAAKRINSANGIPIPAHMPELAAWEAWQGDQYTPIRSIMIPVFGTGGGDRGINDVCERIATGINRYLQAEAHQTSLTDIHIGIYSNVDLAGVVDIFDQRFQRTEDNLL
jgi:hypothetical protein